MTLARPRDVGAFRHVMCSLSSITHSLTSVLSLVSLTHPLTSVVEDAVKGHTFPSITKFHMYVEIIK